MEMIISALLTSIRNRYAVIYGSALERGLTVPMLVRLYIYLFAYTYYICTKLAAIKLVSARGKRPIVPLAVRGGDFERCESVGQNCEKMSIVVRRDFVVHIAIIAVNGLVLVLLLGEKKKR